MQADHTLAHDPMTDLSTVYALFAAAAVIYPILRLGARLILR